MKAKLLTTVVTAIVSLSVAVGCSDRANSDIEPSNNTSANVSADNNTDIKTNKSPSVSAQDKLDAKEKSANANSSADNNPTYLENEIFAQKNIAIKGADTVAYFTEGKLVRGSAEFTHQWKGATWQFASAKNKNLFVANPEKYAPQYGGYCAYAVSRGYTASIVPEAWTIFDNKLYLNYSKSVQAQGERDIPGNINKGDANWPAALAHFR